MGAWGTGLFCDDVACDVRARFGDLLAEGCTVAKATRQILSEWQQAVKDEDDGPVIWLALASLQWDQGSLQSRVRSKAFRLIDSGADLNRWRASAEGRAVHQRRAVLRKLRQKLESAQPTRKSSKPRHKTKSGARALNKRTAHFEWRVGELVAYRLRAGDWILLHVIALNGARRKEDIFPDFAVLNWRGRDIPSAQQLRKLRYMKPPATTIAWGGVVAELKERRAYCISVAHRKLSNVPVKRLQWLSLSRKLPFRKPNGWFPGVLWRLLDAQLERDLGLK